MDKDFQGGDPVKGSFRRGPVIAIGRGSAGTDEDAPECTVCFAEGGGDHGGFCPNGGRDPGNWVTEPPPGFERPGPDPREGMPHD